MNKDKISAIAAAVLLTAGCSSDNIQQEQTETQSGYIAVYKEIISEETTENAESYHPSRILPDIYTYNYLDHTVFVGDELCGEMTEHGLISESSVISEQGFTADKLTDKAVIDKLVAANKPYIYIWTGAHDVFSGITAEEYSEILISAAEAIRESCPESMISILSITPAAKVKNDGGKIDEFNSALNQAIKEYGSQYITFTDINTMLCDNEGFLSSAYDKGNGVELSRAGCRKVLSILEDNRMYNELSGDAKYHYLYKDIFAERPDYNVTEGKVAYLTFDDGPSKHTPEILDILAENNIKATFFITGWCIDGKEDILKRIAADGHTVGIHSYSHDYEEIYASCEAWLNDFVKVYNRVYDITGEKPWAFRFPGGSYNNFNKETADTIITEMKRRGFAYYDWNSATSDAMSSATYDSCMEYFTDTLYSDHSVVLMHDSLELTPEYLPDVIAHLKEEGYSFETIDTADEIHF